MEATPLKSANELAAEMRGDDADAEAEQHKDPKAQPEYTFEIDMVESGTGRRRKGKFKNHALNLGQKRAVGVMQAQLSGGVPWASLSPFDQDLIMTLAHLQVSLDRKVRPKWARNLEELYDQDLLDAIYEEVADHEATFHGREPDKKKGAGDSEQDVPDGGSDDLASGKAPAA